MLGHFRNWNQCYYSRLVDWLTPRCYDQIVDSGMTAILNFLQLMWRTFTYKFSKTIKILKFMTFIINNKKVLNRIETYHWRGTKEWCRKQIVAGNLKRCSGRQNLKYLEIQRNNRQTCRVGQRELWYHEIDRGKHDRCKEASSKFFIDVMVFYLKAEILLPPHKKGQLKY